MFNFLFECVQNMLTSALSLRTEPQSNLLCCGILLYLSLPSEKKSYVPPPPLSWICFLLIFGQTKKPLHGITNGRRCFFSFHFAMLCNGFEIQACLCNFQFSKSLAGILGYHIGYMTVKILGKFFSMPCGQDFYSLILILGEGILTSHPIAHRKV